MGTSAVKKLPAVYRLAFFALLIMTMVAATLHCGALTAEAAQATLAWSAPTTNTNGTAATNLAGFNVYVGTSSGSYSQKINAGDVTSYTVANLNSGSTYYFAVTAYNTSGMESTYSNQASKTFPAVYTITATVGSGGTITALNNSNVSLATNSTSTITSVSVTSGASQSFSIAPSTGNTLQGVTVDGTPVGAVTSYTFSSVTATHTISATFAAATSSTYTITASAGTGGSISPSGSLSVASGASQAFTITPASGYSVAGVTVDGTSVGAVGSYKFSAVSANHTIQASFAATTSGGSGSSTGSTTFAANSGGANYVSSGSGITYPADSKYSGGSVSSTTATISGTSDGTLYQSERYGNSSYNVAVPNGNYNLTLKFAEIYFAAAGQRVFNVTVNGQTVISNLDIYAKVGKNVAYDVVVPVSVTNGTINIGFVSVVNWAKVSAIRIAPVASGTVAFATNSGSAQYASSSTGATYLADTKYSGGSAYSTTAAISGTTDGTLYQSERYGNFAYSIPVANGNYSVTLKFAELYFSSAGQRVFSVTINGQTVISNLDIYAKVGQNAAYDVVVPVSVTNGAINVNFVSQVNNAKLGAMLIKTM